MNIITTIDGPSACITVRGDIDHDTLPQLRAAADVLPAHVTDLLWDLNHTPFMDVAGLHLFFAPAPVNRAGRRTTVTGVHRQPLRLLLLAADLHPDTFDLARLLQDAPPSDFQGTANRP
ncbi:STAS domain-containing protein [Streptomyces sp. NPDC005931]|uniref:STAS domain-containing protein n=1 Tax=Streptomyces sp. NPDC005931 TaxID=3364737 RepID=UPI0036B7B693